MAKPRAPERYTNAHHPEAATPHCKMATKIGPNSGKGRPKGAANKTTRILREAVLLAAEAAGGKEGLEGFLKQQAKKKNNAPFMALMGKILPLQIAGDKDNPVEVITKIVRTVVRTQPGNS